MFRVYYLQKTQKNAFKLQFIIVIIIQLHFCTCHAFKAQNLMVNIHFCSKTKTKRQRYITSAFHTFLFVLKAKPVFFSFFVFTAKRNIA